MPPLRHTRRLHRPSRNNKIRIYKKTFTGKEWAAAKEDLFKHYKAGRGFSDSAAEVLAAENAAERLMLYVEKHLSLETVEKYHKAFAAPFPAKTLELFRKAIDKYVEKNTGRAYYGAIAALMGKMLKIKDGEAAVSSMIARYRAGYKNRKAMIEILDKFCKKNHL
jgi:hypothetical protein